MTMTMSGAAETHYLYLMLRNSPEWSGEISVRGVRGCPRRGKLVMEWDDSGHPLLYGVYAKLNDGTEEWLVDYATQADADRLADYLRAEYKKPNNRLYKVE